MNIRKLFLFILYSVLINQTIQSQVNAGSDFTICKCDGNTRLNGKYTGDPNVCVGGIKYKWTAIPTDSTLLKNDTLLSPNICPKVKTKYKLTIDGNNDEVEVTVNDTASDVDFKWDTLKPYGWDDWEKFGNILNSGLKDTSEVPYQSIEMGKKIKVKLNIKNLPKSYECIYFNSSDETIATVTPEKATANNFDIEITALKKGEVDISAVVATKNGTLVKDMPKPTKLRVVVLDTLPPKKIELILVNQSSARNSWSSTSIPSLTNAITYIKDSVYKQAVISCEFNSAIRVCNCNFDIDSNNKLDVSAWTTSEMDSIIVKCKNPDPTIFNIFLVDNPHDSTLGFSDISNKRYAFVHVNKHDTTSLTYPISIYNTLAHESGHGLFGLVHPDDGTDIKGNASCVGTSATGPYIDPLNVMDYCDRPKLRYFQWTVINP